MNVVLLGPRGCGKTTIGRKLADRLWWKFVDTDERVAARAGMTIAQIFEIQGESAFRDMEATAVLEACALSDHVIALGGGAVLNPVVRETLLRTPGKRIYLRCDPEVLANRIENDPLSRSQRPRLTDAPDLPGEMKRLIMDREPFFRQVMTAEIDVTALTPAEAVVYITRQM
jgi:shikimate kinase